MSSTSGDEGQIDKSKSFGWVIRSLLPTAEGVKAFLWIPDTIFFDSQSSIIYICLL